MNYCCYCYYYIPSVAQVASYDNDKKDYDGDSEAENDPQR